MKRIVKRTRWKSLLPTVVLAVFFCTSTATRIATVSAAADQPTVLGIEGTQFTLNGKPTFLLGISYYGALGASEDFIRRDLDDMERYGFNWLRVWATWDMFDHDVSAVDGDGGRGNHFWGNSSGWLLSAIGGVGCGRDAHAQRRTNCRVGCAPASRRGDRSDAEATSQLVSRPGQRARCARRPLRIGGGVEEAARLVRRLDPPRLVTASFGGHDLSEQDVRESLLTIGLDFLSPHRPRTPGSPAQTKARTRECLALTNSWSVRRRYITKSRFAGDTVAGSRPRTIF